MHEEVGVMEGSQNIDDTVEEIQVWQVDSLKNQRKIEIPSLRPQFPTLYEDIE